jgi:AbrB family looped-hinge helix DNA binding protein
VESLINTKGRVTIPKAVREQLGLKPGDRIKFFLHPNGGVVLLPRLAASAPRGVVRSRQPPVTIEEMEEAAAAGAARLAAPLPD